MVEFPVVLYIILLMAIFYTKKFKILLLFFLCAAAFLVVMQRKLHTDNSVTAASPAPAVNTAVPSTPVPTQKPVPTPSPSPTPSPDELSLRRVKGNNVCIRDKADVMSANLDYLYYGNTVKLIKADSEWSQVEFGELNGFVHNEFLCLSEDYPEVDGEKICDYALTFVGTKYKWGGQSPDTGFDCSGFLVYVFDHFGLPLNRIASDQALNGVSVEEEEIRPGDIVCFKYGSKITHSGIYIGDGRVVHAANEKYGVMTAALSDFSGSKLIIRRMT